MLTILRLRLAGVDMPSMNSNRFSKYCESIKTALWDEAQALEFFKETCNVVDTVVGENYNKDFAKNVQHISRIYEVFRQKQ